MYDEQILRILLDVGVRGISTKKLAKHVYNHFCTLFYQPDFNEVYHYVQLFLRRHSRSKEGMVKRAGRWGHYRINNSNPAVRLLMQGMSSKEADAAGSETQTADLSLSLDF